MNIPLKKVLLWAGLLLLLVLIAYNPAATAEVVRTVLQAPGNVLAALASALANLVGGGSR